MKNIRSLLMILILIIPIFISAKTDIYESSVSKANQYIFNNVFESRNKYLYYDSPLYGVDNSGNAITSIGYTTGGMLNAYEYEVSLKNGFSYLVIPNKFWTMSKNENFNYYLDGRGIATIQNNDELYETRVTQIVKPKTVVTGEGTLNNPWEFVNSNYAILTTSDIDLGYFCSGSNECSGEERKKREEKVINSDKSVTFDIFVKKGYENDTSDGCKLIKVSSTPFTSTEKTTYKIENINGDYNCVVKFKPVTYMVTYNKNTTDAVSNMPLSQVKTHGIDITLSNNTPTRTGYLFDGWNTNSNKSGSNYAKGGSYTNNSNVTLYAKWKDTTKPNVKVTAYRYDTSQTNNLGARLKTTSTFNNDGTYTVSSDWINSPIVFKMETLDNETIKSIRWQWNNANQLSDSNNSYPNSSDYTSNFSPRYPSFNANGTGQGYRKAQWIVKDAEDNTIVVTVVAKIDTAKPVSTLGAEVYRNVSTPIRCTDNIGVTAYYFGTKSSPSASDYTAITSNRDFSDNKTPTTAGSYYLFCKDAAGNVSDSKTITVRENNIFTFKYSGDFKYLNNSSSENTSQEVVGQKNTNITLSANHWYVKFLTDGTLTINTIPNDVQIFAVGGGGGGGGRYQNYGKHSNDENRQWCILGGGDGGSGGAIYNSTTNGILTTNAYAVDIGAGGLHGTGCTATTLNTCRHGSDGGATTIKLNDTAVVTANGGAGGANAVKYGEIPRTNGGQGGYMVGPACYEFVTNVQTIVHSPAAGTAGQKPFNNTFGSLSYGNGGGGGSCYADLKNGQEKCYCGGSGYNNYGVGAGRGCSNEGGAETLNGYPQTGSGGGGGGAFWPKNGAAGENGGSGSDGILMIRR